jgi:uncharacterized protein
MVKQLITKFIDKLINNSHDSLNQGSGNTTAGKEKIDLAAFVDFVVRSLVEHPEEVSIETDKDDRGMVIKVSCKKSEIRRIIGKQGKTINAIRALVRGAAKRISQDQNVNVIVNE